MVEKRGLQGKWKKREDYKENRRKERIKRKMEEKRGLKGKWKKKEDYKEMDEKKGLQGTCKKRENYKENGKKIKINHQVFLKQLKNSLPQRNIYKRKDYKEMEKKKGLQGNGKKERITREIN